jgi:hypothetical protein
MLCIGGAMRGIEQCMALVTWKFHEWEPGLIIPLTCYQFTCVRAAATPRVGVGAWKCFAIANCEIFMYVKFAQSAENTVTGDRCIRAIAASITFYFMFSFASW